jgi:hypothetical protein
VGVGGALSLENLRGTRSPLRMDASDDVAALPTESALALRKTKDMLLVKRVYEPQGRQDGTRCFVERLTPLYSARDRQHNSAVALKTYLDKYLNV